jgi:hypothetical protein
MAAGRAGDTTAPAWSDTMGTAAVAARIARRVGCFVMMEFASGMVVVP